MRKRTRDPDQAPRAERVNGFKCDHCDCLHIALWDEDGYCLGTAVIDQTMMSGLIDIMHERLDS